MADLGNNSVFSQTDASNASGTMPSWSGSAAPSTLDDAGRAFQGAVTREWNWRSYTLTAAGTDTKTLTYSVAPAAYYNGQRFAFINGTTNTGGVTVNVNGLGAIAVRKMVNGTATALAASDMVAGAYVELAYRSSGAYFAWTNYDWSTSLSISGGGTNKTPGVTWGGQLGVLGNGYTGGVSLDATGMWVGHNSALRQLIFAIDSLAVARFDTSGNFGIGVTTPAEKLDVDGGIICRPGTDGNVLLYNADDTNSYYLENTGATGAGNAVLSFYMTGVGQQAKMDASGNFLMTSSGGLGYGTGSGGTVTQATSKSTGVTLNKTNGKVTMNNAALAASAVVTFSLTNSTIAASDVVIANVSGGIAAAGAYRLEVILVASGSCIFRLTNISGGSLSEAVELNFAVIKAATA